MLKVLNTQLFMLINAAPNTSKLMITIATFCAEYLIYTPLIVMIFCWFKRPQTRGLILKIIVTVFISLAIATILRSFISSPRPFELAIGTNFLPHSSSNSFPSKHATFIFAITFALFYGLKNQLNQQKLFISCLVIGILVSWSRIYLGVHWPLDILAGILTSFGCAYLVNKQWHHIERLLLKLYSLRPIVASKLKIIKYVTKNSN